MSIEDEIRVVRIKGVGDEGRPDLQWLKAICKNPVFLHVNQESRVEGLRVYRLAFATRLIHPVYFDFAKDFLVFDGERDSTCHHFRTFMHLNTIDENEEREAERQMMHSELRNLAMSGMGTWLVHQELDEFCNLDNLIVSMRHGVSISTHILQYEWARRRAGEEPRLAKSKNHLEYTRELSREWREYSRKLEENPDLLNCWPNDTRILSWYKDMEVSVVGSWTWTGYQDKGSPWASRGIGNVAKEGTLSKRLNECNPPKLEPWEKQHMGVHVA